MQTHVQARREPARAPGQTTFRAPPHPLPFPLPSLPLLPHQEQNTMMQTHVNRSSSTTNVFALQLALVTFQLKPLEFSCGICFSINASLYGAKSIIMPQWIIWSWYTGRWWVVQRGRGDWAGEQPAQAPPRCTKCNSPHINGQCTNHHIAV